MTMNPNLTAAELVEQLEALPWVMRRAGEGGEQNFYAIRDILREAILSTLRAQEDGREEVGYLSWHKDSPHDREFSTLSLTAADEAAGYIEVPVFAAIDRGDDRQQETGDA